MLDSYNHTVDKATLTASPLVYKVPENTWNGNAALNTVLLTCIHTHIFEWAVKFSPL